MVSRIIVPLDQSHLAECAVPYARALAKQLEAPITLLTVLPSDPSLPDSPPEHDLPAVEDSGPTRARGPYSASLPIGPNPGPSDLTDEAFEETVDARSEANEYLNYIGASISEAPVESRLVYGDPVDRIIEVSAALVDARGDFPLIVMASHGRSGLGRVLLGSVALSIAERTPCPLFLVRALSEPVPSVPEIQLNNVLVALDGSDHSEAVVDPVRHVFGESGGMFHLMTAVDLKRNWLTGAPQEADPDGRTARDDAEQYLSTISDRLTARGVSVTWDVVEGDPAERINQIASDVDADLIALATHGRSGMERLTVGSVAEEVLHQATRPLFIVRPGV